MHAPHLARRLALAAAPGTATIRSTIDGDLQRRIEGMAQHWAQSLDRHTGVAVVVADAGSGAVLAHLGSPDFFDGHRAGQVDMTRAVRSPGRSEEHTSELQSLMRLSYAGFCVKKNK